MSKVVEFFKYMLYPKPKKAETYMYALMSNGPMQKEALGKIIFKELMKAYNMEYKDTTDKDDILSAMSTNFGNQVESAWQAFLAEVGFDE